MYDDTSLIVFGDKSDFEELGITEFTVERAGNTYFVRQGDVVAEKKPMKASDMIKRAQMLGGFY